MRRSLLAPALMMTSIEHIGLNHRSLLPVATRLPTGASRSSSGKGHQRYRAGAGHDVELLLDPLVGRREWEDLLADLHIGVSRERVPEYAVKVDRQLRHQVMHPQLQPFLGIAAFRQRTDEVVFIGNTQRTVERADLVEMRRVGRSLRRRETHAEV